MTTKQIQAFQVLNVAYNEKEKISINADKHHMNAVRRLNERSYTGVEKN